MWWWPECRQSSGSCLISASQWKASDITGSLERQHYLLKISNTKLYVKFQTLPYFPARFQLLERRRGNWDKQPIKKTLPRIILRCCLEMVWSELRALFHVVKGAKLWCWSAFVLNCATDATLHWEMLPVVIQGSVHKAFPGLTVSRVRAVRKGGITLWMLGS